MCFCIVLKLGCFSKVNEHWQKALRSVVSRLYLVKTLHTEECVSWHPSQYEEWSMAFFFYLCWERITRFFFARLNSPDLHVCLTCRSALSLVSIFCHLLTLWAFRDWLLCLLCTLWYYKSLTDYSDSDGRFYLKSILQWCNRYIIHYKMGFIVYIFTFLQCNKKTKLTLSPTKYLFIYILA